MRSFLRLILTLIFVFLTPFFLILVALKTSGISAQYIKNILGSGGVYKEVINELRTGGDFSIPALTPKYLQAKVEKLIDDTDSWLSGRTANPPVVSFDDLSPASAAQLKSLIAEAKTAAEQAKKQAEESGQPIDTGQMDQLTSFMDNGLSFNLGQQLTPLKDFYWWTRDGFIIISGIMAVCLAGIVLLSESAEAKLGSLGTLFLISFFWNIIPSVAAFLLEGVLRGLILESKSVPAVIISLYSQLTGPLFTNLHRVSIIGLGVFLTLSILFFSLSSVYKNRTKVASKDKR